MKTRRLGGVALLLGLLSLAADWQVAEPGWSYQFPEDHHAHENFKTEWWYFTGNLDDAQGRRFGYELTFFRQGIRPPNDRGKTTSRFVVDDLKFAHFTVTDPRDDRFVYEQKVSRGAFGEAGFDRGNELAWIEGWRLTMNPDGRFALSADSAETAIQFALVPQKPPVIHGDQGISRKAAGSGHASHYYSIPRLATSGTLRIGGKTFSVTGESWFDHEWATNQLAPDQAGWNWVSAQFADGTDLMLYQMRLKNGATDPISSGTFIRADGSSVSLQSADFQMTPVKFWESPKTKAKYPISWRVVIPKEQLDFRIEPVMANQELVFTPLIYWEGAFDLAGTRAGKPLQGRGYLELTGYAAPLQGLNR